MYVKNLPRPSAPFCLESDSEKKHHWDQSARNHISQAVENQDVFIVYLYQHLPQLNGTSILFVAFFRDLPNPFKIRWERFKKFMTLHYADWFIGIFEMACWNPYTSAYFLIHYTTKNQSQQRSLLRWWKIPPWLLRDLIMASQPTLQPRTPRRNHAVFGIGVIGF